jgi:murein DD-endopeptidase MepM/ murein hydrolase activator NlpD
VPARDVLGVSRVQHAKPGTGLHRLALPALLVAVGTGAYGGLAALAPHPPRQVAALAVTDSVVLPLEPEAPAEERALARASRARRITPTPTPTPTPAPPPPPPAEPVAAPPPPALTPPPTTAPPAPQPRGACPVPNATFTDTWGAPRSGGRTHQGTDLMAPHGSPVYAVASGTVRTASSAAGGISLYLHADNGERYFYAHNAANVVRSGQRVRAGALVARVGSSGNAPDDAPHVHFEREVNGVAVNPYRFLRRLCG